MHPIHSKHHHRHAMIPCMKELQNAGGILFFLLERLKTRGRVSLLVVPDRVTEVPLPAQSSVLVP